MKATNIKWDTDGDKKAFMELPDEIKIPKGMENPDEISDYITKTTGFCHFGFKIKEEENTTIDATDWIPVLSDIYPEDHIVVSVTYMEYETASLSPEHLYSDSYAYRENGKWLWADENTEVKVQIIAWRNNKPYIPITDTINATFSSVWDDGQTITTNCKVNMKTKEVFDIEHYGGIIDNLELLEREYITVNNIDLPVFQNSDLTEKDNEFWYE